MHEGGRQPTAENGKAEGVGFQFSSTRLPFCTRRHQFDTTRFPSTRPAKFGGFVQAVDIFPIKALPISSSEIHLCDDEERDLGFTIKRRLVPLVSNPPEE